MQPTGAGGGAPGVDVELYSEVLRVQTKLFYLDCKRNVRGAYLKIAERSKHRPKSSIVLPIRGLREVCTLFAYYDEETAAGRPGQPRDIIIDSKVFSFSTGDNERGKFLRINESGGGYPAGGSSLIIPAEWGSTHLATFRECLERLGEQMLKDGLLESFDLRSNAARVAGVSTVPGGNGDGTDTVLLDSTKEGGPVLSVGSKHFFFELRKNQRGAYLKIKEVCGNLKNLLVLPVPAAEKFQEAINLALMGTPQPDLPEGGGQGPGHGGGDGPYPYPGAREGGPPSGVYPQYRRGGGGPGARGSGSAAGGSSMQVPGGSFGMPPQGMRGGGAPAGMGMQPMIMAMNPQGTLTMQAAPGGLPLQYGAMQMQYTTQPQLQYATQQQQAPQQVRRQHDPSGQQGARIAHMGGVGGQQPLQLQTQAYGAPMPGNLGPLL